MRVEHPFPPLYGPDSERLILGSFPSVKSRETTFFYGHPQNRFWKIIAALCHSDVPKTIEEKTDLIIGNGFALWDVIASCEIVGSSDSSITNVRANDLNPILSGSRVKKIYCNGTASYRLYRKYIQPLTNIEAAYLPSSSPANAAWSLDRLIDTWGNILNS